MNSCIHSCHFFYYYEKPAPQDIPVHIFQHNCFNNCLCYVITSTNTESQLRFKHILYNFLLGKLTVVCLPHSQNVGYFREDFYGGIILNKTASLPLKCSLSYYLLHYAYHHLAYYIFVCLHSLSNWTICPTREGTLLFCSVVTPALRRVPSRR